MLLVIFFAIVVITIINFVLFCFFNSTSILYTFNIQQIFLFLIFLKLV